MVHTIGEAIDLARKLCGSKGQDSAKELRLAKLCLDETMVDVTKPIYSVTTKLEKRGAHYVLTQEQLNKLMPENLEGVCIERVVYQKLKKSRNYAKSYKKLRFAALPMQYQVYVPKGFDAENTEVSASVIYIYRDVTEATEIPASIDVFALALKIATEFALCRGDITFSEIMYGRLCGYMAADRMVQEGRNVERLLRMAGLKNV